MSKIRTVDEKIRLIPYYRNDEESLVWYQDLELVKQVDNSEEPYTLERLHRMYDYLCENGECFYIEYEGKLCGDISLRNNGEIAIVICKEYQNRQIGRKCVRDILLLAKQKKYKKVLANVYSFNKQSYHMFKEAGFLDLKDEWLVYYVPYEKAGLHVMPQADVDMLTLDKYEEGMN